MTLEWIEFGCIHKFYPDCVPAVRRPKLVTETGLIVRQYYRLSQQQLSYLLVSVHNQFLLAKLVLVLVHSSRH